MSVLKIAEGQCDSGIANGRYQRWDVVRRQCSDLGERWWQPELGTRCCFDEKCELERWNDFGHNIDRSQGFPGGSVIKNRPANAGDAGSIPGLGRSPGEGMTTHSSILAWEIPWTEEPGRLQSVGSQRVGHSNWPITILTGSVTDKVWNLSVGIEAFCNRTKVTSK